MRILPLIFLLVLLLPNAQATVLIPVDHNADTPVTNHFTMVGGENYSFVLTQPAFSYGVVGNTTPNNQTAIGNFYTGIGFPSTQISSNHNYHFTIEYNGSKNLELDFQYIKTTHLIGADTWDAYYTVSQDGLLCYDHATGATGFVNSIASVVGSASGIYTGLRGATITVSPAAAVSLIRNETERSTGAATKKLFYALSDGIVSSQCVNTQNNVFNQNLTQFVWGNYVTLNQLTEGPNYLVTATNDNNAYNMFVFWQAQNITTVDGRISAYHPIQDECKGLHIDVLLLDFCFDITPLLNLVLGGMLGVLELVLSKIPGGPILYQIIKLPFDMLLAMVSFVNDVIFNNGSPYGVVGLFWFHIVYAFTIGCIATCFTGNWKHPFVFPWKLAMAGIYITIYGAYFFFWLLPKMIYDLIMKLWMAITNPIP